MKHKCDRCKKFFNFMKLKIITYAYSVQSLCKACIYNETQGT